MNLLAPAYLLAAAAIILPIVLHLLRRRVTRTIPFPSLRFLTASNPADRRRQSIRRWLVLALRCLALLALALAFGRPFFGQPAATIGRATIIVVDNSYSLQSGQRWTDLKRWATNPAAPFDNNDTLGLLLMNPRPTWFITPTQDTANVLRTLDSLPPGWQTTRAEPALRLAGDVLAATPARQRRLIYLGDHQAIGWAGSDFKRTLPPGVELVWPAPPTDTPDQQAAITTLTLRHTGEQNFADLTVRNYGPAQTRAIRITLNGDESTATPAVIELPANGTAGTSVPLPAQAESIKWIRAHLDPDQLPADDTAWATATTSPDQSDLVLLDRLPDTATGRTPTDFVATAFTTLKQLSKPLRTAPASAPVWPARAVAVLRAPTSFEPDATPKLNAFLQSGGTALIFLDGQPEQLRWLATHGVTPTALPDGTARLRDWDIEHPLVAPLAETSLRGLVGWSFARGWSLPADTVDPIASWSDGTPALGELRIGAGRVLLAGWSAERRDGDWPISPAFVPFLHRAVAHLLGLAPVNDQPTGLVGQTIDLPAPGRWEHLDAPAKIALATIETTNTQITPELPGLYRWSGPGETRYYAVNVDPAEGDLTPWSDTRPWEQLASTQPAPTTTTSRQAARAAADAEQQSPLWWWCFAALALFLIIELPLASRTTR